MGTSAASTEIFILIGLLVALFLYQLPLNVYLCGMDFKKALSLLWWSVPLAILSWVLYRSLQKPMFESGHMGFLVTMIVFANFVLNWIFIKWLKIHEKRILDKRVPGWILFSPVLMIAVVISAPLFAAILLSLIKRS